MYFFLERKNTRFSPQSMIMATNRNCWLVYVILYIYRHSRFIRSYSEDRRNHQGPAIRRKVCARCDLRGDQGNDFNLNIPRYVDTFEEEAEIDIDAVQKEIDQIESELAEVRAKMAAMLKEIERQ